MNIDTIFIVSLGVFDLYNVTCRIRYANDRMLTTFSSISLV